VISSATFVMSRIWGDRAMIFTCLRRPHVTPLFRYIAFMIDENAENEGAIAGFTFTPDGSVTAAAYYGALGIVHRVVAWSSSGEALVLDGREGRLVPARTFMKNFQRVEMHNFLVQPPPVGVLPGGGWRARFAINGESGDVPVVGWRVGRNALVPLIPTVDGGEFWLDPDEGTLEIYHPDVEGKLPPSNLNRR
jgi:hypothetical protein